MDKISTELMLRIFKEAYEMTGEIYESGDELFYKNSVIIKVGNRYFQVEVTRRTEGICNKGYACDGCPELEECERGV